LFGGFFYVGSVEFYLYVTRSEAKAQAAAEAVFAQVCDQHALDRRAFHGPVRPSASVESDEMLGAYTFRWRESAEREITVSVTYLPYDVPYSMSEGLIEGKPHDEWKSPVGP
jgi:hypothetical protein